MPHAFRVASGFVRETRVIEELVAPTGFVLASAGEFDDVTSVGLIYRAGVYRWKYVGGSPSSVVGELVEQARPEGARIVRLDGDAAGLDPHEPLALVLKGERLAATVDVRDLLRDAAHESECGFLRLRRHGGS